MVSPQKMIHMKSQAHNIFGNKNIQEINDEHDIQANKDDSDSDDDSEYDDLLHETDDALKAIRQKRIKKMSQQQSQQRLHTVIST